MALAGSTPDHRVIRIARLTLAVTVVATVLLGAANRVARGGPFVAPWQASQLYVSYAQGFVRRGLPGEILRVLIGGRNPTIMEVLVAAGLLTALGVAAFVLVAFECARRAASVEDRLFAIALVVASPFTFSLLVRDIGRYDVVGYAVLALAPWLAGRAGRGGRTGWRAVGLGAVLLAVATACEEFLFVVLAPVVAIAVGRQRTRRPARVGLTALVLAPAAGVFVASFLHHPSVNDILSRLQAARSAGVAVDTTSGNALTALAQDLATAHGQVRQLGLATQVVCIVALGGTTVLTTVLLRGLIFPTAVSSAGFWGLLGWSAAVAVVLGEFGIDYRRWWALAFVSALSVMLMPQNEAVDAAKTAVIAGARHRTPRILPVWAVLAAVELSVAMQLFPVYPVWTHTHWLPSVSLHQPDVLAGPAARLPPRPDRQTQWLAGVGAGGPWPSGWPRRRR